MDYLYYESVLVHNLIWLRLKGRLIEWDTANLKCLLFYARQD
jgi:hypothetical protein